MKEVYPTVRYQSALNKIDSEDLIDIRVAKNKGSIFFCPHCKGEMVPRCGEHNAWHFAHKRKECGYDKYLHTLAELKILKWIRESQEIKLALPYKKSCSESPRCSFYQRSTCASDAKEIFDLKKYFGYCEKEKEIEIDKSSYIPDLLWHNQKNESKPLFIEIFVTHPCSEEKIASGVHIIEFHIQSEEDIDRIISSTIQEGESVRLYNFNPLGDKVGDKPNPPIFLYKYSIFRSHKTFTDYHTLCRYEPDLSDYCKSYTLRRAFFEMTYHNEYDEDIYQMGGMEVFGMAYASQYDKSLKHCWLCKNQTFLDRTIICRFLKERGSRYLACKDASRCHDFQRDENIIKERINILNRYRQTHYVDLFLSDCRR